MKKQLTIILTALPLVCSAGTATDTTFTYNEKRIVVKETGNDTKVTVETLGGESLRKLSETTFVNDQEVTQVYVTSPFMPNNWASKHRHTPRYRRYFSSHIPWFSCGFSMLGDSPMSFNTDDNMKQQPSKSWEFAIAPISVATPFNRAHTFGISAGLQVAWIKQRFKDGYTLDNDNNGTVDIRPITLEGDERVRKSYVSYMALRVPVNFEFQSNANHGVFFITLGASLEWRFNEHSRYKTNMNTITPTKDININPIGLNLEAQVGYFGFAVFVRTAVTPLMKTSSSPKAYPTSIGLAFGF